MDHREGVARHLRSAALALALFLALLVADARPGWCPFAPQTPGQEVTVPELPPVETSPTPDPSLGEKRDGGRPAATPTPRPRKPVHRESWHPSLLSTVGISLLGLILLYVPSLWMRKVFRQFDLPPELQPRTGAWSREQRKKTQS